ncbi:MAG: helix-turn-helix domain-containing protein [Chloroflexota bacterium]|nr:helix-turn-helix domain-containing protein [Chloroflexota bacterium]
MADRKADDTHELARRFGQRVRELRLARGISSQDELGARAGLHRTFIGRVERGETNITLGNIAKLAEALGVSLADLFSSLTNE